MSAGQPINDELETRQVGLDSQAHCEFAMKSVRATAGWGGKPESVGRIDQITTIPKTVSARSHEIKIDKSHRVLDSDDNQGVRVGLIVGALVASTGLTWFVISALPLPFALTSGSGSGSSVSLDSSSSILESKKEDRLPIRGTNIHGVDRRAPAQLPESSNPFPLSASNLSKPTLGAAPTAPSAATAGDLQSRVKLTPTPETRPTTIEGWTLREVTDGTAVLEGPDGIRRVARGDTIPGVGRVESIFRWGNRLMVATSRGLISTP